ncbi:FtsK/SpoIIIE domain-containing protein [Neobacillus sp. PS3-40]|uniref:FtsK/SpoIIIE domain-containing protein n=1 Tax=Neobacillus sp. PS3-40 TaxID=3070679 RepID=UPI0027E197CA|nr:FtsK/SpoIIIE domain-containing protein [Neobacillus sp. PS3-40]WML42709.1 FtsK/SpoIIIE domain-containing protein [Neobacillus sp. PS3-40]
MGKIKTFIRTQKAKAKLRRAFKSAGLINKFKNGEKEIVVYPMIHDVKFDNEKKSTRYVFTLINGMDPKEVEKKEYVFNQHFGKNIELDGDYKKFELTVYELGLTKDLTYKYEDIASVIEGLKMPIVCGKDRNGQWIVYDAITEPNALISGEPGSGKSTQIRSILSTLIKYKSPEELHLYLGDLKMSEFHLFKGVQHVKNVAIFPDELKRMLTFVYKEMISRSKLLNAAGVMHVDKLPKDKKVPYILLAIDEIVMVMDDKELKKMLVQIDSLGRALGIYNILSLQRPSHDILDTKVRSLLTVRMGFRTTDLSNSKIIGTPGSEKISRETPGRFFLKRDSLEEIQAPYLTEEKAKELLEPYKSSEWENLTESEYEPIESIEEIREEDIFNEVVK